MAARVAIMRDDRGPGAFTQRASIVVPGDAYRHVAAMAGLHDVVYDDATCKIENQSNDACSMRLSIALIAPSKRPTSDLATTNSFARSLSVPAEHLGVAPLPRAAARRPESVGRVALVAETARLAASAGEAALFTVLVHRVDDPVDARVVADNCMAWVHADNLVVLVSSILVDPVAVEYAETANLASDTLLGDRAQVADELQLGNTLVLGLSVDNTLANRPLASTTTNSNAENRETLLGLVAEHACLVRASGLADAVDLWQLTVLPRTHTQQEAEHCRSEHKDVRITQRQPPNTKLLSREAFPVEIGKACGGLSTPEPTIVDSL